MKIDRKQIRYSLQLLIHLQKSKAAGNQDGYAMLITSILAILMFSMLSVYLFSANLYKSVANAVVDSGSTFYAAESGMNRRANIVRDKFVGYSQPTGTEPDGGADIALQMQNCISNLNSTVPAAIATLGTGDLACNEANFDYKESLWKGSGASGQNSFTEEFKNNPNVKYRAYSFVKRLTIGDPVMTRIPPGDTYSGLNMQEYRYRLYSTALKNTSSDFAVSAQTLLQMDFNSQLIPLFQFAAFYQGNMEVSSSTNMSLNGPVHSNSSIYYGPGGVLTVGQTTAVGRVYKSLINAGCSTGTGRAIQFAVGAALGTSCNAAEPITAGEISARNGLIKNGASILTLPPSSALSTSGEYFSKADLQVTFDPDNLNSHPYGFGMTSVSRTTNAAGVTTATPSTFTDPMLRSLRQPVMLVTQAHGTDTTTEWTNLCTKGPSGTLTPSPWANFTASSSLNTTNPASLAGWTLVDATQASNALRRAIAKTGTTLTFTQVNSSNINSLTTSAVTGLPALNTAFSTELNATTLDAAQKTTLLGAVKPREIANKAGNCFLPPPMQVLNNAAATPPAGTWPASGGSQTDRQEARAMKILQANIHSLTVWNRDGQYDDGIATTSAMAAVTPMVPNAAGRVFARAAAGTDASVPVGSYDWMGMAASDTTERGLVWHSAVDNTVPAAQRSAGASEYGFGFSGGRWLPGPLTLATDQIAYIQGDLNNPGGAQPLSSGELIFDGIIPVGSVRESNLKQKKATAVMADAIAVLSNNCVDVNGQMDCFNVADTVAFRDATRTSVNAAFLSGTSTGGGLNNYMRMMENWHYGRAGVQTATSENLGPTIFRYRGSFVSIGPRIMMPAVYRSGCSPSVASATCYYNVPERDFGFDTSFNTAAGLPPLSPQAVYLKQKVFRRDYDNNRS
jgi:hypothetical protein